VKPTPAVIELDDAVYDGGSENAKLVELHHAIAAELKTRELKAPKRYRPGQELNPDLVEAAQSALSRDSAVSESTKQRVLNEVFGVGALQPLIENPEVSEIYLNGAHCLVSLNKNQESQETRTPFSSVE
jgi:Flp pilus assembly CpaF family ATPase